jgi:hypothetical protein
MLKLKNEYLNPFKCFSNFGRSMDKAMLCNLASEETSSKQLPFFSGLMILMPGRQPKGGKLMNPNFLPPLLYIACENGNVPK